MRRIILATLLASLWCGPAAAQADFSTLKAVPGDKLYVLLPSGVEVGGIAREITPQRIVIDGYQFEPERGLRIQRPGDPIWNGAAIGFGIGLLGGLAVAGEASCSPQCVLAPAITYGAIGALIDWAVKGRRSIYRITASTRLVPILQPERRALAIVFSF